MTRISEKMICANCGAEMNHHAMKIDYSIGEGTLQEVHTCPNCGRTDLRQADEVL